MDDIAWCEAFLPGVVHSFVLKWQVMSACFEPCMEKKQYKWDSFIFKNITSVSLSYLLLHESVWYKYYVYFKTKVFIISYYS